MIYISQYVSLFLLLTATQEEGGLVIGVVHLLSIAVGEVEVVSCIEAAGEENFIEEVGFMTVDGADA